MSRDAIVTSLIRFRNPNLFCTSSAAVAPSSLTTMSYARWLEAKGRIREILDRSDEDDENCLMSEAQRIAERLSTDWKLKQLEEENEKLKRTVQDLSKDSAYGQLERANEQLEHTNEALWKHIAEMKSWRVIDKRALEASRLELVEVKAELDTQLERAEKAKDYSQIPSCSVCLEDIKEFWAMLPCGHANQCYMCAIQVLQKPPEGRRPTCPACRTPVMAVNRVYLNFGN